MKKILFATMLAFTFAFAASVSTYAAPTKQQKRVAYTLKNLKLDAATQKKLQPVLMQYLTELKEAQKPYDDLKKKYKNDIDNGLINDRIADALLKAKWASAKAEIPVKEKYEKLFGQIVSPKKVYYIYTLINDKMSKIDGTASSKDDDDDE